MTFSKNEIIGLQFDRTSLVTLPVFRRVLMDLPNDLPKVDDANDPAVFLARRSWEDRTRAEYLGVLIVHHFHGLLVDLNAPADLQELALVMMLQEQRHAALCNQAAIALGGTGEVGFEPQELVLKRTEKPLEEQIWHMILGTYCCGEVTALALIQHTIRVLPKSPFRDILQRIARDEVLHAAIGPRLLALQRSKGTGSWLPYPGDEWIRATLRTHRAAMRTRSVIEPDEAMAFQDPHIADRLQSFGVSDSGKFLEAYRWGVDHRILRALAKVGFFL